MRDFLVAQLGARRHYAVPRALQTAGRLAALYTDICGNKGWPRLLSAVPRDIAPGAVRRLAERRAAGVPTQMIHAFTSFGWQYARRKAAATSAAERTDAWLWAGQTFGQLVVDHGLGDAEGVYVFNSAGLEVLHAARAEGRVAVLDQTIAPRRYERELMRDEHAAWPGWDTIDEEDPHLDAYCRREEREWVAADRIVCGSEFVRDTLVTCGVDSERCVVAPYGLQAETPDTSPVAHDAHAGPLRVLTVGEVGLRKGSPYVLRAAQRLAGVATFRMVGDVAAGDAVVKDLNGHVELVGAVPRSEVTRHYAWADVLLLPSLCEGSAASTYEAMHAGLPVVCTPNAGSVVRDGVDGCVVPPRDVDAIVARLEFLAGDLDARQRMGAAARRHVATLTLDDYGKRLIAAIEPPAATRPEPTAPHAAS
ncbi:MAG: glycosyltransferase [Phycisphaera sp.]|nr:glycosyltransferase [Phycisphaera sp.]